MKRVLATAAIAGAVLAGGGAAAQAGSHNVYHGPHVRPTWMTRACPAEDSNNCYWDAGTAGNGVGHSYWAIPTGPHHVTVVYWNKKYNERHGYTEYTTHPNK